MRSPTAILAPNVQAHDDQSCPLCNEAPNDEGSYSELALKHSLEVLAAKGKLLKILMDDGEIYWQEPEPFYEKHSEFRVKERKHE